MKVFAGLYKRVCSRARIPLSNSERQILKELTDAEGWVDRELYIETVKLKTSVYITESQKTILKWLPTQKDDPFVASEKNRMCQILVKKIIKRNME